MTDHFAVLGLPRRFEIDLKDLERRFREISLQVHPDRFAQAAARDRRISLERSTSLNDAYRTLRDPARRAAHLLALSGLPLDSEGNPSGARLQLPPEFLEEQLELHEALLEAKGGGDSAAIELLLGRVRASRAAALAELSMRLREELFPAAAVALARLRYCDRFLSEAAEA